MDILQQIISMDKAAAARAEQAIERERKLLDESGEESARENDALVSAEREKSEKFCREKEQALEKRLREAKQLEEEQCGRLDEIFNAGREKWKAEIIKRITEIAEG